MVALENVILKSGAHESFEHGACVMELVSYVAGEPWSDHPQCVSPVIGAFLRKWNDDLNDDDRQKLRPYIQRVIGTNTGFDDDERRAWMLTDLMVRVHLPAWLRLAKLDAQADAVAALPELVSPESWLTAKPAVEEAGKRSAAARDAAGDAAGNAAAWNAARNAAWDAAGDAARNAAGDAAWNATWNAARNAAGKALRPTVVALQESAFELLDRMIAVGERG